MKKGLLITFYGINNIGKSTHAKLLVDRLKKEGYRSHYVKYPVYELEPTGPFLHEVLRSPGGQKISEDELQLWFILNRYQFEPEIKRMLEEGYIVIAEDYVGTGLAWGMAKGLEREWLESVNKHLLKEDFTILMEGKRDDAAREKIHIHEQNENLMRKCEKIFSDLGNEYEWNRVEIQEKIENTAEIVWKLVEGSFLKNIL